MSDNSHIMAVRTDELVVSADDFLDSAGLEWCGDTFETGYVFREQIDTILAPLLRPELLAVLNGAANNVTDPSLAELRAASDAESILALTPTEYAALRAAVEQAVAHADWGYNDTYEWEQLLASDTTGDYFLIVEY